MKKRFGFFDIVIVVAIILVAFAGYKFFNKTSDATKTTASDIMFTVEVKNDSNNLKDIVKVGDKVYDSIKGGYYGEVVNVEAKTATAIAADTQTGEYKIAEYNDPKSPRDDVYITIKGTPTSMTEEHIQFASQKVKIGNYAYLKSTNFAAYGYVVGIDILE
jgi:hypothetical protein